MKNSNCNNNGHNSNNINYLFFFIWRSSFLSRKIKSYQLADLKQITCTIAYLNENIRYINNTTKDLKIRFIVNNQDDIKEYGDCQHKELITSILWNQSLSNKRLSSFSNHSGADNSSGGSCCLTNSVTHLKISKRVSQLDPHLIPDSVESLKFYQLKAPLRSDNHSLPVNLKTLKCFSLKSKIESLPDTLESISIKSRYNFEFPNTFVWPSKLNKLHINAKFYSKFPVGVKESYVIAFIKPTTLPGGYCLSDPSGARLESHQLANLTKLKVIHSTYWSPGLLPNTLQHAHLVCFWELVPGVLPHSITKLKLIHNHAIPAGFLPPNLKTLIDFGETEVPYPNAIPTGVTTLSMHYFRPILRDTIPSSVTCLDISNCNTPDDLVVPPSVAEYSFGRRQHTIAIPHTVRQVFIDNRVQHWYKTDTFALPAHCTHLTLAKDKGVHGIAFNDSLRHVCVKKMKCKMLFPDHIQHMTISILFHDLATHLLPANLRSLKIKQAISSNVKIKSLPLHLKFLHLPSRRNLQCTVPKSVLLSIAQSYDTIDDGSEEFVNIDTNLLDQV
ncbi:hypothetical protein CYY_001354 [Polysphondylium violaceum]|uniref:Uncharacterized protein n=1 Tax=Polysphondylium violaceum TaxID=133409 RepID=A0A8J4Q9H8_9MYCE|nr:hypothetical protein CYY_001354 [Polysphondylium violaceum]